ncbi:hypothetical protein V8C86DRAFT_474698 [Haematococcus lacustris]
MADSWSITPNAFKHGYSSDVLLTFLARDVLRAHQAASLSSVGTPALAAKKSLENVQRLVGTLDRAHEELTALHEQVTRQVEDLQHTVSKQTRKYQAGLAGVEELEEQVRETFREVEGRCNKISQTGTRLGDRLQVADSVRGRALELAELLQHLQAFSQLPLPGSKEAQGQGAAGPEGLFRQLGPLFWEEKRLLEAATTVRKLTKLTAEANNAQQRSRLVGAEDPASPGGQIQEKGSLAYTTWQLATYCAWMEQRVLARFDKALQRDAVKTMAECASVMALFDAERVLMQVRTLTPPGSQFAAAASQSGAAGLLASDFRASQPLHSIAL